jgi:hypothetical protein
MFLFSKDKMECRDLFAREASIINEVQHKKKFFVADTCKFDIIKSDLFDFSRNKNSISLFCSRTWFGSGEHRYSREKY